MKSNKLKSQKYYSEEQQEIRRFIIILGSIIFVVLAIYIISNLANKKNDYHYTDVKEGEINNDIVTVGTMFNRPEGEYYVIAYDEEDVDSVLYESTLAKYNNYFSIGFKKMKVYYCDTTNKLNEAYVAQEGENSNPKAKTIDELKLGKFTFLKISNGKIVKYIEDINLVETELGIEES